MLIAPLSIALFLQAGAPVLVLDKPTCTSCRIVREMAFEFGRNDLEQELAPEGLAAVLPLPSGRYLGIPFGFSALPLLIESRGRSARAIGRRGAGPGEFNGHGPAVPWLGDSLLIHDGGNSRISVFNRTLGFARSFTVPYGVESIAPLSDGRLVIGRSAGVRGEQYLDPISLLDRTGKTIRPFDRDDGLARSAERGEVPRLVASNGTNVWSMVHLGTWRVTQWNPETGKPLKILTRKGDLYPERKKGTLITPTEPPEPAVFGLSVDGGVMWVFYAVAGRDWKQGIRKTGIRGEGGVVTYPVTNPDRLYDVIVDALDASSGELLASARFEEFLASYGSVGGMAMHTQETSDGERWTRAYRFRLAR